MKKILLIFHFFIFGAGFAINCLACNLTISPGASLSQALNSSAQVVCLNPGIYKISSTIYIPAGKTLEGLGSDRNDVVIESSVPRGSVMMWPRQGATMHNFTLMSGASNLPTYGIYVDANDVIIWSLLVKKAVINVAFNHASRVKLLDTYLSLPGDPDDHAANPNLWINESADVTIWYGAFYGGQGWGFDANGALTGDGEVGVYRSRRVDITGPNFFHSGTSAFYLRNCDDCSIRKAKIYDAGGFGLDLVDDIDNPEDGNNNLIIEDNTVTGSVYGAAVIKLTGGNYVRFTGNTFQDNNLGGYSSCSGINVLGGGGTLILESNQVTPAPVSCAY